MILSPNLSPISRVTDPLCTRGIWHTGRRDVLCVLKQFFRIYQSTWKYIVLVVASAILVSHEVYAQKPAQFVRMGDDAAAAGRHAEAEAFYRQAYVLDSSSFDITIKYAEEARIMKDYRTALNLYEKAWSKDQGKLFAEGLFWIAMLEKQMGRYEIAEQHFRKYLKKNKKKGNYYHDKASQEAAACAWVLAWRQTSDSLEWSALGAAVSTPESENAPFLDGSKLLYSRYSALRDLAGWELVAADWNRGAPQSPIVLSEAEVSEANLSVAKNGEVFFTRCEPDGECEIWTAVWDGSSLKGHRKTDGIHEAGSHSTMPHFAEINGVEYLFFVSDRDGGEGKLDIWYSRRRDGRWEKPINAGKRINSRDDEVSPFYSSGVLYFSSDWHKGFGGLDVFRSTGFPGSWGEPENMGKPVNSAQNDLFFSVFPSEGWCFVSSNRTGSTAGNDYPSCCNDMYGGRFGSEEQLVEETFATLAELNRFLPVRLYFHNDEPNPRSRDSTTTVKYSEAYASYMQRADQYAKELSKGASASQRDDIELEVEGFFQLQVDRGMKDLELFAELLLAELKEGKNVQLSIRGFASPRAQSDYNEILTKRRIRSLINELNAWNRGALIPYIKGEAESGGQLSFRPLPFGEGKASSKVSDDLADEKGSIYGLGARLERKIEIESVELLPHESPMQLDEEAHSFGRIRGRDGIVYHTFLIANHGADTLRIDSLAASCGCTEPVMDRMEIEPGGSANLKVGFDPFGKAGRQIKTVTIYPYGDRPRTLLISAIVED